MLCPTVGTCWLALGNSVMTTMQTLQRGSLVGSKMGRPLNPRHWGLFIISDAAGRVEGGGKVDREWRE